MTEALHVDIYSCVFCDIKKFCLCLGKEQELCLASFSNINSNIDLKTVCKPHYKYLRFNWPIC